MWELLLILGILLLLFGSAKLPQLARSLGSSINEFKDGLKHPDKVDETEETPKDESDKTV
jgi:sec-independent protein translocase protein TatA